LDPEPDPLVRGTDPGSAQKCHGSPTRDYLVHFYDFRTIELEEKYGGKTYQTQKAKEEKKKSGNKAAIGIEAL
jgi:hypothetical protein